jgi:hypothetical protein
MLIGEVGFSPVKAGCSTIDRAAAEENDDFEPISKLALGLWRYTPRFPQLLPSMPPAKPLLATHWGAYLLAEQSVYRVPESNRDLAAFVPLRFHRRHDQPSRLLAQRRPQLQGTVRRSREGYLRHCRNTCACRSAGAGAVVGANSACRCRRPPKRQWK